MHSLTVMGICSNDFKNQTRNLVFEEANKIKWLKPETSVVVIKTEPQNFKYEFNRFCLSEITNEFNTDFVLLVQFDGRIIYPNAWQEQFYNYDYIGAPWKDGCVGNGGFSLRSHRLCEFVSKHLYGNWIEQYAQLIGNDTIANEDSYLCRQCKSPLEQAGFTFATQKVASQFSVEHGPYSGQFGAHHSFLFGGKRHNLKKMSNGEIKSIIEQARSKTPVKLPRHFTAYM